MWARPQGILSAQAHAYAPVIEWLRTPALKARLHRLEEAWMSEVARLLPELRLLVVATVRLSDGT